MGKEKEKRWESVIRIRIFVHQRKQVEEKDNEKIEKCLNGGKRNYNAHAYKY